MVDQISDSDAMSSLTSSLRDAELPHAFELELIVKDRDTIAELYRFSEGEPRCEFALAALRIGVLALRQARGQLDGDTVRREAERMLSDLKFHLHRHAEDINGQLSGAFKEYFDPANGRFHERIERLIKRDGELESLLRSQVGTHDSEMCRTLTAHFGEQSPLMKRLSPEQKDGLLAVLQRTVEEELRLQSEVVLKQFSLDNEDGALKRFMNQLSENQEKIGGDLKDKVDGVIKELSLDDESSFFSRLQRTLDKTSETIKSNLTLDDENSSLARLRREVRNVLLEQGEANQKFQEEVKTAINALVVRREESLRSTTHGKEFQQIVADFLMPYVQRRGDVIDFAGDKVGVIKNCKKGDFVAELGPDSAAPGARLVAEAKEEKRYSLADARVEIEEARKNRGAEAGLFIFSKLTAPLNLDPFTRLGNDVFIIWDRDNPATDVFLQVGFDLAKALCLRAKIQSNAQSDDINVIDAVILDIEKNANSLDEVTKLAETIHSHAEKIIDRAKKAKVAIIKQVLNLQERFSDLKERLRSE